MVAGKQMDLPEVTSLNEEIIELEGPSQVLRATCQRLTHPTSLHHLHLTVSSATVPLRVSKREHEEETQCRRAPAHPAEPLTHCSYLRAWPTNSQGHRARPPNKRLDCTCYRNSSIIPADNPSSAHSHRASPPGWRRGIHGVGLGTHFLPLAPRSAGIPEQSTLERRSLQRFSSPRPAPDVAPPCWTSRPAPPRAETCASLRSSRPRRPALRRGAGSSPRPDEKARQRGIAKTFFPVVRYSRPDGSRRRQPRMRPDPRACERFTW